MDDSTSYNEIYVKEDVTQMLLERHLPLIIFTSIMLFIGIIGNIMTLLFYITKARKTSTTVFIISLAAVDITVCCFASINVADLAINILIGAHVCKAMMFFNHWTVTSSVLILWINAIDRTRKICYPHGWQFDALTATRAVIAIVVTAFVMAIPHIFTVDVYEKNITAPDSFESGDTSSYIFTKQSRPTNNSIGHFGYLLNGSLLSNDEKLLDMGIHVKAKTCTHINDKDLQILFTISNVLDCLIVGLVFMTIFVTYSWMCARIRKQRKLNNKALPMASYSRNHVHKSNLTDQHFKEDSCINETPFSCKPLANEQGSKDSLDDSNSQYENSNCITNSVGKSMTSLISLSSTYDIINKPVKCRVKYNSTNTTSLSRAERNITVMMCAVSIGYIVCFLPYFIVYGIYESTEKNEFMEAWVQFMCFTPFYNSVINPIIYCFFNPQFRTFLKQGVVSLNILRNKSP